MTSKNDGADKRKVSTDALETLGTIIGPEEKRDAIHLAVVPVRASVLLRPGEDVTAEGTPCISREKPFVGIVDPFLKQNVNPGEWFWLVLYPRQITSLRHVWTHPEFPDEELIELIRARKHIVNNIGVNYINKKNTYESSLKWIEEYAEKLDRAVFECYNDEWFPGRKYDPTNASITASTLIKAAEDYLDNSKTYTLNFEFTSDDFDKDFWSHFQAVTGRVVKEEERENFFRCSC